jgi:hypothetical protein
MTASRSAPARPAPSRSAPDPYKPERKRWGESTACLVSQRLTAPDRAIRPRSGWHRQVLLCRCRPPADRTHKTCACPPGRSLSLLRAKNRSRPLGARPAHGDATRGRRAHVAIPPWMSSSGLAGDPAKLAGPLFSVPAALPLKSSWPCASDCYTHLASGKQTAPSNPLRAGLTRGGTAHLNPPKHRNKSPLHATEMPHRRTVSARISQTRFDFKLQSTAGELPNPLPHIPGMSSVRAGLSTHPIIQQMCREASDCTRFCGN